MKYRKIKYFIFFLVIVFIVFLLIINIPTKEEIMARKIIQNYIEKYALGLKPGTEEYKIFMRKIFWGEIPELTEVGSDFINNEEELRYVNEYAWKKAGYKNLYGSYQGENNINEATLSTPHD